MSTTTATGTGRTGALERSFRIRERGSTLAREVRGGVVTFFTMAYIVVLNPLIIGFAQDGDGNYLGGSEPHLAAVAAGTALTAGVLTILMGVVANYPLALATGLGLNAFVAFSIASGMTWADAMGLVVLEGLIILVLVLTGFRQAVFYAVPAQLKTAISVGIGLFIALIGFFDAGFMTRPASASARSRWAPGCGWSRSSRCCPSTGRWSRTAPAGGCGRAWPASALGCSAWSTAAGAATTCAASPRRRPRRARWARPGRKLADKRRIRRTAQNVSRSS